jgi:hypothetical protein
MRDSNTLRKQTTLVRVPVSAYFFVICFILTKTQLNCAITHPLFNYSIKTHLCAPLAGLEMQVMQIFQLFFHNNNNYYFFYQHSDLEGLCSNGS